MPHDDFTLGHFVLVDLNYLLEFDGGSNLQTFIGDVLLSMNFFLFALKEVAEW